MLTDICLIELKKHMLSRQSREMELRPSFYPEFSSLARLITRVLSLKADANETLVVE